MENKSRIALACGDSLFIRSVIELAHGAHSTIIICSTKEEAEELSMQYQPWPIQPMYTRELRYYEGFMTMKNDLDNAFAQSIFVNKLALKKEKKNRKNNARVQYKNEMAKFNNRRRG